MRTLVGRIVGRALVLCCFLGMVAGQASAATVYVKPGGAGRKDGSTWKHALAQVQAGIDKAVSGDQVWVAAGTYSETITP